MKAHPVDERIEDLTFLDETGVGATQAAERTGFASAHAMEKWLERQGRTDLWLSLKRRDPAGTHLSGTERKERRLMSINTQTTDPIAALITQAQKSTRARTRKKADRVSDLIGDLRTILGAEREEDDRKAEARKEIERLERELAKAKAKLKGGTATALDVDGSVSAAELREWAAENGIDCPAKGRVPAAVREAYEADVEEQAS